MRSTKLLIFGSPKAPSIQRLGGLKLPSSRGALHAVIENGNDTESKWVVYAALRTGDVSVLPRVKQLLAVGDRQLPESAIASQLRFVSDPFAVPVPDLITILQSAPGELTRECVLTALGEELKDTRAVPALAVHLLDPDLPASYRAVQFGGSRSASFEIGPEIRPANTLAALAIQNIMWRRWAKSQKVAYSET